MSPSSTRALSTCAAALLLLTGCADGRNLGAAGQHEPCPIPQLRDGLGECRQPCGDDFTCAGDDVCLQAVGLCVPPEALACTEGSCPPGFACSDKGAACVPAAGYCETNFECPAGERCDANRCVSRAGDFVQTCTTSADCGPMMNCQFGVCTGCITDLQCGPEGTCVFGTCFITENNPVPTCVTEGCNDGYQCSLVTGECEKVCSSNDDCGANQTCLPITNRCVEAFGCESHSDCHVDLTCLDAFNLCYGCVSDEECLASETCIAQLCLPRLESPDLCTDNDCDADAERCDPLDGSCYLANGTCASNDDCRPDLQCNLLSLCSGCTTDNHCRPGQRCLFGTCVPLE